MSEMTLRDKTGVGLVVIALALTTVGVAGAQTDEVTFSRDIAPILQRSCQGCHRPGQMGPMSLMTYAEVRPWRARFARRWLSD